MNSLETFVKSTRGETREVLEQLVHQVAELVKEQRRQTHINEFLTNDNRLLRKRIFGVSSEKQNVPEQEEIDLFNEFELCAETLEPELPEEEKLPVKKKPPGRQPLPAHLPRTVVEHDLTDEEKQCACGREMTCIGSNVSEELYYQRAKIKVVQHCCKKYGCASCNGAAKKDPLAKAQLKTASKPLQLIPKSIATHALITRTNCHSEVLRSSTTLPSGTNL